MLLALYRGTPSIRFSQPPACGGILQPRSDAGERSPSHLGCWFDTVKEVRSGPSQATRDVAVAGILKILQPLPARDVSKKMFPPATLLRILRIVCARALQNRKLDPGVTEYKFKIGQLVYSIPKGRASYGTGTVPDQSVCPRGRVVNFSTRSGAPSKTTIGSQERAN